MNPYQAARAVYDREPCARTFEEDLELHLLNGYVFSDSTAFLMARPVKHYAGYELICDPSVIHDNPDCWHLWLFAGNLMDAFRLAPYPLPLVSFERKNKLRYYQWYDIYRKCLRFSK